MPQPPCCLICTSSTRSPRGEAKQRGGNLCCPGRLLRLASALEILFDGCDFYRDCLHVASLGGCVLAIVMMEGNRRRVCVCCARVRECGSLVMPCLNRCPHAFIMCVAQQQPSWADGQTESQAAPSPYLNHCFSTPWQCLPPPPLLLQQTPAEPLTKQLLWATLQGHTASAHSVTIRCPSTPH